MSETTRSQAIMFDEPVHDDLELRAGRGESADREQDAVRSGEVDRPQGGVGREGADEREQITFEQGYEELKAIVARLDAPELPIHEMFDGFRRGKGLEKTLRAYLQEREGELAELEAGNNLAEFEIVAPPDGREQAG
jgi:exodeoxyribonuclease VII small subunit